MNFLLNILFGHGLEAVAVIIFLEIVLCIDSLALCFTTKNKIIKIVHILLAILWAVCAILNVIYHYLPQS